VPGTGFDRMSVDTPEQQRKLVDEAKKRVKRLEDD
jgi:Spy/CpxP family protein refolding chaperone